MDSILAMMGIDPKALDQAQVIAGQLVETINRIEAAQKEILERLTAIEKKGE